MWPVLHKERKQTKTQRVLESTTCLILTIWCFWGTSHLTFAQQRPKPGTYQTTHQAVSSKRQVAMAEPVKPVPDFWSVDSGHTALLTAHDRLDRKNLPMLYHFSYSQSHQADWPATPGIAMPPEPQYRNNSNDLDARLRALKKSTDDENRTMAPTPSRSDDSSPLAQVKLRRLPPIQGIVAIDDF